MPVRAIYSEGFTVSLEGLPEAEAILGKTLSQRLRSALRMAISTTLTYARDEALQLIVDNYDITKAELERSNVHFDKMLPSDTPTAGEIRGKLSIVSSRLPTIKFNVAPMYVPNQKGIPVSARQVVSVITARGSQHVGVPNRFMARMSSGHLGVFLRKPGSTHRMRPDGQKTQLPIMEEMMISPSEMVGSRKIRPILEMRIRERLQEKMDSLTAKGLL